MCTYNTVITDVSGSAKGPSSRWFHVDRATVYYDHPVHVMAGHALNIDLTESAGGPGQRVALELTADSARALVRAIEDALAAVPPEIIAAG
ncbi:DUF6295 family protein [Microlunatus sp. Gsoil 973]|uniref:DUF6295 family protein n=1 Tax=Microlunatus sp. Gsoil 973 TaxID=2672569 RepID=UPI0012B4E297|nr:DUF6295 family protein [Microlunatus sp. Gsoil 973]QGN34302.1 hypothetical protein GJV80_17415 [Microlunatus sp. Gsoil 973]